MQLVSKKKLRYQKIKQALKNNLRKRKKFQNKIKQENKKSKK